MVNAAYVQGKIYGGYAKAALRLGYTFEQYRPTGPLTPLGDGPIASFNAAFSLNNYEFMKSGGFKDVIFQALFDGGATEVGDFLINEEHGTYFIAAQQDLVPILCVRCNHVIKVHMPGPAKVFGADSNYGGTDAENQILLIDGCPASILLDARGRATEVGLPTDLPSPFFQILMPNFPGTDVRTSCFITDDNVPPRRYTIAASDVGPLGNRISAQLAVT